MRSRSKSSINVEVDQGVRNGIKSDQDHIQRIEVDIRKEMMMEIKMRLNVNEIHLKNVMQAEIEIEKR